MRYLDIRSVLSEEEKINCTFRESANDLGFLDPKSSGRNGTNALNEKSKVLVPFWLAENLSRSGYVDIEMPDYFNSKMREAIHAGPLAIKFRSYSFHFFEVGLRLSVLKNDQLIKELRTAFCGERYKKLMDMALVEDAHDDVSEYRQQELTAAELVLFDAGIKAAKDIKKWLESSVRKLNKAALLGSSKRK